MNYINEKLYRKEENSDGSVSYIPYDINGEIEKMTICGKSIKEVVDILSGLEVERLTEIKMTMENLSYLFDKVIQEQNQKMAYQINEMRKGFIEKGE